MKIPREIGIVARRLRDLRESVVFVGGMIRSLLITDPAAGSARPTKDVDLVLDVPTQSAYVALGETLRAQGFRECADEGAPLCRWTVDDILVDVMPIDPAILGFSNVWYAEAMAHSTVVTDSDGVVRILDAPRFCATKLEAFASRGNHDYYHHDIEDIIAVLDGRATFVEELEAAPSDLRHFLASALKGFLSDSAFADSLPGHLQPDDASQARLSQLKETLHAIASMSGSLETPVALDNAAASGTAVPASATGTLPGRTYSHSFVRSSNLRSATYAPAAMLLTIHFRGGRVYSYVDVPQNVYSGLAAAYSAGRYFHYWIKKRYRFRRLR